MTKAEKQTLEECRDACIQHRQVLHEAWLRVGRLRKGECKDLIEGLSITMSKLLTCIRKRS
jgi:hypothetical protein